MNNSFFWAVNYETIVFHFFRNNIYIGSHEGGFTPFNFDDTDKIKNGENFIIIKVNNSRKTDNVPTWYFDWWNYEGITRDVYIIETGNIYIQNFFFLHKNILNEKDKRIIVKVELNKFWNSNSTIK